MVVGIDSNHERICIILFVTRVSFCICSEILVTSFALLIRFIACCNASRIIRKSDFAKGVLNSFSVLCRIGHSTGYGSNFLVPAAEGVGGTTDLSFIGTSFEGRIHSVIVGLGCCLTINNPCYGIAVDGQSCIDCHVLCRHLAGTCPAREGITCGNCVLRCSYLCVIHKCYGLINLTVYGKVYGVAVYVERTADSYVIGGHACGNAFPTREGVTFLGGSFGSNNTCAIVVGSGCNRRTVIYLSIKLILITDDVNLKNVVLGTHRNFKNALSTVESEAVLNRRRGRYLLAEGSLLRFTRGFSILSVDAHNIGFNGVGICVGSINRSNSYIGNNVGCGLIPHAGVTSLSGNFDY